MLDAVLQRFIDRAPMAVAVRGAFEYALDPAHLHVRARHGGVGALAQLVEEGRARRGVGLGVGFDFAGDELSGEEQAKILSHAIGRPINYQEIPIAAARQQSEDTALMFEWFDRVGYDVDIAALRRDFSEVRWHSFSDWAREFDWSVLERTSSVA